MAKKIDRYDESCALNQGELKQHKYQLPNYPSVIPWICFEVLIFLILFEGILHAGIADLLSFIMRHIRVASIHALEATSWLPFLFEDLNKYIPIGLLIILPPTYVIGFKLRFYLRHFNELVFDDYSGEVRCVHYFVTWGDSVTFTIKDNSKINNIIAMHNLVAWLTRLKQNNPKDIKQDKVYRIESLDLHKVKRKKVVLRAKAVRLDGKHLNKKKTIQFDIPREYDMLPKLLSEIGVTVPPYEKTFSLENSHMVRKTLLTTLIILLIHIAVTLWYSSKLNTEYRNIAMENRSTYLLL